MSDAQAAFVTRMARTFKGNSVSRSAYRPGDKAQETWVFIWNDLDKLFQHLHGLAQDPMSGFGLVDVLWVMAAARWQARNTERQQRLHRATASHHTGRK